MKRSFATTADAQLSAQRSAVTWMATPGCVFPGEWPDQTAAGIYVDINTGEPLFASSDKYAPECKWPGFTKPIVAGNVRIFRSTSDDTNRAELRSTLGNTHLGHVLRDGPPEWGGLRYCVNPASLRFVHRDDMKNEGYEQFLHYIEEIY
jgi:peptide-methionine (R)-S-oxide reductase